MKLKSSIHKVFDVINRKSWLSWLIVIVGAILVSFASYAIFNSTYGAPEVNLYQPNSTYSQTTSIASAGRKFINSLDYRVVNIIGWVVIVALIALAVALLALKKMKWRYAFLIVFALSVAVRIVYTNTTDNIFTRQYDVWSSYYTGHYSITMHIYSNDWALPGIRNGSLDNSYQLYHPKVSHYTYALIMHINSLFFGKSRPDFTLYESVRIFTCTLSIITVYIGYLTFKELFKKNISIFVGTVFVAFSPLLIRLSAGSNNDPMLYFFMFLATYFAIKFYKHDGWINILGCAISIGLAMGSKLSGALIAIPIGILFVYKFIRIFVDNKGNKIALRNNLIKILSYYVAFLALCAPIGLYWPIYNYVNYKQPFTYVWANLNQKLLIPAQYTFFDRYGYFSFRTLFLNMFHSGWNDRGIVDYNLYTDTFKSSIFGEYTYTSGQLIFCCILYGSALIMLFGCLAYCLYTIIYKIIKKDFFYPILFGIPILSFIALVGYESKKGFGYALAGLAVVGLAILLFYLFRNYYKRLHETGLATTLMIIIFLTFLFSFFTFQIKYPYTCTHDFRYIGMFILCGGYCFGKMFEKHETNKNFVNIASIILGLYCLSSIGLYCVLG